jgi:predicted DNA-binding transcriptional regulator AlpA
MGLPLTGFCGVKPRSLAVAGGLRLAAPMSSDITQKQSRLLSRADTAAMLNMSAPQLDRLARTGVLPVIRIDRRPRFLAEDVEAFIRSRRQTRETP